jgi:hypothetical protein
MWLNPQEEECKTMMSNKALLKWQLVAASSGFFLELLYLLSWGVLGHNIPPASPSLSAADMANFYAVHHMSILLGQSIAAAVGILWMPWTAQLTVTMLRIEGPIPVLTIIQLMGGTLTTWVLIFCPAIWATAAYRLDIDPSTLRTLNDLGFFFFELTYMGTTLQAFAAGIVGLHDKSPVPVFPRWVNYWAFVTGLSFIPVTAMPFVTSGPFAWNGLVPYWIGFGTYFTWTTSMGWYMAADVRRRIKAEDGVTATPTNKRFPAGGTLEPT